MLEQTMVAPRSAYSVFAFVTACAGLFLACDAGPPSEGASDIGSAGHSSQLARAFAGGVVDADEDVTWPAGSMISLDEDLEVRGNLYVEHGVVVTAAAGVGIRVADGGSLLVQGRSGLPALFTAASLDRWAGIEVQAGGTADVHGAIIERLEAVGISGATAAVVIYDSIVRDVAAMEEGGDVRGLSFVGGDVSVTDTWVVGVVADAGADGDVGSDGAPGTPGSDGTPGEVPANEDPIDPVLPVAGGGGADGGAGTDGQDGGEATGIYIGADTTVALVGNRVEDIVSGAGGTGAVGGVGGDGGAGGNGAGGQDGAAGGPAGSGGGGGIGGAGGAARGIWLEGATVVSWLDNRVDGIRAGPGGSGGDAGVGGKGGAGGAGGDEVEDADDPLAPGMGAAGGDGGSGSDGGAGESGGIARAVHVDATDSDGADGIVQSQLANVLAGAGGDAGSASAGGAGGNGGEGGNAATQSAAGGAGGDGGSGGAGGAGPDGGAAGLAVAIEASGTADDAASVSLSTVLALVTADAGDGGLAGTGGAGGTAGLDGASPDVPQPVGSSGTDGPTGADGSDGDVGEPGLAAGVWATADADVSVHDNIFSIASSNDGFGLVADDTSVVHSDSNIFWQVRALGAGDVTSGARDRIDDPRLIDAAAGDARLRADSPAIDAGDNAFLPVYVTEDIDGEDRPVDDPDVVDVGSPDARPVVDIGAHEFQPPSCDTDPNELWPPNHKYVAVEVDVDLGSLALADAEVYVHASSSEPDNAKGDGNTTGDVDGYDGYASPVDISKSCTEVEDGRTTCDLDLRAERAGPGQGRVYTIDVRVEGEDGTREVECEVDVPHDQGGAQEDAD
jgi:hypothetical protein